MAIGVRTALLWDESFLWGLMAHKALKAAGLPFKLLRSEDIKKGVLSAYKLLFVPGGWASNKAKALGAEGAAKIREFVDGGGNYVGFCGGAGLATAEGIGLLDIRRKPTKERVPSFSGRIRLNLSEHPLWKGITEPVFHAWWPSQFLPDSADLHILADYGHALPDSFSSDLNVGDTAQYGRWPDKEKEYGINLNPGRLLNDPAVVEGTYGRGKALLSLIHFDTPEDDNGGVVLKNIWNYLAGVEMSDHCAEARGCTGGEKTGENVTGFAPLDELESAAEELISFGRRNFLWFWRNPMLLQWRRGVRGLEYCTALVMLREIAGIVRNGCVDESRFAVRILRIKDLLMPFVEKSKLLLTLERHAMLNGPITYESCGNTEIQGLREELFGKAKSHGGMFKELIDEVDALLFTLL